jgi:tetratricopeptide (TPR) repeat protein
MVIGVLSLAFALQAPPSTQAPPAQQAQPMPEVITRSRVDMNRGVDFHALVVPDTVYVGQQATYQLGVFLDQDTRQRIRRNPEFQPPETRSLLSYDLRERAPGTLSGNVNGRPYEMHVFRRALFPLTPGRYAIPAARLTYSLPQTASFFSREESYTLRSEPVDFVVIEPPLAGRPSDWAGAVGVWRAGARVDTLRGRAGEPFVLTLRVEGQGNVTLLPRPHIAMTWAGVVNADERVRLDSTPSLLGGWKEFDWLVTPTAAGAQRVPSLRYAYFNPRTRRYEIASTTPVEVRIAAGDIADTPTAEPPPPAAAVLEIRSALGEEAPQPLGNSPLILGLVALAPFAALGAWLAKRPKRAKPLPTPRQRLEVMAKAVKEESVIEVRRALADGLTLRTGLDPANLTEPGAWTRALRKEGVSSESAAAIEALLSALDEACFADAPVKQPRGASWVAQAREALDVLDDEVFSGGGRYGPRTAARIATAILLVSTIPGFAASAQSGASDAFAQGATAYAGGDYVRAARHFEDAAREAPRSAAAWDNLGAAALMAHDTATAVLGWQRALRLEPTNAEIRAHLASLRVPQDSNYARVLPIPGMVAVVIAVLFWVSGWVVTARQSWRRHSGWRVGLITAVAGGVLLWFAYEIEGRLEGRSLVVITGQAPLRNLPSLTAESRSTPMPGEVASVITRQGVWVHLRLDGAREGWMPAERVAPLGRN